ncbi:hypothetical protein [Clostridium perfringens]|uniref:hypothetical protein n=1 Tax=Clostridium perfringens TaxID=1502 RepID=UPI00016BBF5F|nr:hypothetical protein [Clostridium perfringens]
MNFFNKNEEENSAVEEKSAVEVAVNEEGNVENVTFDKSEAVAYGVDLEAELEDDKKDEKNNEVDEQGELLNPIPTPVSKVKIC